MALHPAMTQVLLVHVRSEDSILAKNPEANFLSGIVCEIGSMPDTMPELAFSNGDLVYFNAEAPQILWPPDERGHLVQVSVSSIIGSHDQ